VNNTGIFISKSEKWGQVIVKYGYMTAWCSGDSETEKTEKQQGNIIISPEQSCICVVFSVKIKETGGISVSRIRRGKFAGKTTIIFFTAEKYLKRIKKMTNPVEYDIFGDNVSIRNDLWQSFCQT